LVTKFSCGNGAVAVAAYGERYLLVGCYDGYIYVLNKITGTQTGRFAGAGRMVLALSVVGDKVSYCIIFPKSVFKCFTPIL